MFEDEFFEDYTYGDDKTDHSWCLLKKGKHDSLQIAKINWINKGRARVTEYWYGECSYGIDRKNILLIGSQEYIESVLGNYNKLKEIQEKRYNSIFTLI